MNHLGITTNPLSAIEKAALPFSSALSGAVEHRSDALSTVRLAQVAAPNEPLTDEDNIEDPELNNNDLFKLVAWATLLAPPTPEPETEITEQGRFNFNSFGCAACHRPSLPSKIGQIPLYSDLLLHDMGDELADGIEMGFATGREFRTAPLWGVAAIRVPICTMVGQAPYETRSNPMQERREQVCWLSSPHLARIRTLCSNS